ncbi:MAG: universal stress protein [Rhodospirillales bacterium]
MTHYRKLLLPLSESPCGLAALRLGLDVAGLWGAHLAAVVMRVDARSVAPLAGEGLSGAMIEDMMHATERESAGRATALERVFNEAVLAAEVAVDSAPAAAIGATASLETHTGRDEDVIPGLAMLADLTILPHPNDADSDGSECLHAVLFDSGRPVLIAPAAAPSAIGRRCCVAWNGTVESSAALGAMLPWLRQAEAVRVLHAPEYQRNGPEAPALLPYLALHGVAADVVAFQPVNRDVGAGLLAAAADFGADLLGVGAYSTSRLRQMILGGVTRHVLRRAQLPVLMCR